MTLDTTTHSSAHPPPLISYQKSWDRKCSVQTRFRRWQCSAPTRLSWSCLCLVSAGWLIEVAAFITTTRKLQLSATTVYRGRRARAGDRLAEGGWADVRVSVCPSVGLDTVSPPCYMLLVSGPASPALPSQVYDQPAIAKTTCFCNHAICRAPSAIAILPPALSSSPIASHCLHASLLCSALQHLLASIISNI